MPDNYQVRLTCISFKEKNNVALTLKLQTSALLHLIVFGSEFPSTTQVEIYQAISDARHLN